MKGISEPFRWSGISELGQAALQTTIEDNLAWLIKVAHEIEGWAIHIFVHMTSDINPI